MWARWFRACLPGWAAHAGSVPAILVVIRFINLRGLREAGLIFMVPTYLFVDFAAGRDCQGLIKAMLLAGGHPAAVVAPPPLCRRLQERWARGCCSRRLRAVARR